MRSTGQTHISLYSLQPLLWATKLSIEIVALEKVLQLTKFQIFQRAILDFNGTAMNEYIKIIENSNEFSDEDKVQIYGGLAVAANSPIFWQNKLGAL